MYVAVYIYTHIYTQCLITNCGVCCVCVYIYIYIYIYTYTVFSHKLRCMLLYIYIYTYIHIYIYIQCLITNCGVCCYIYIYTVFTYKLRCMLLGTVHIFVSNFLSCKPSTGGASRSYFNCSCLLMTTDMYCIVLYLQCKWYFLL